MTWPSRISLRLAFVCVASVLAINLAVQPAARAAVPSRPTQWGYIPMSDGTMLRYNVYVPGAGRHPVALEYDPYGTGVDAMSSADSGLATMLYDHGYAVVGLSLPGIACSSGTFDPLSPRWQLDGKQAIEWLVKQPWSDGHLGMYGHSFPSFTEVPIAAERPHGLDAIAALSTIEDPYRDVMYPGGIMNKGFPVLWIALIRGDDTQAVQKAAAQGDSECAQNEAATGGGSSAANILTNDLANPFDDALWTNLRFDRNADRINVPVLACRAWQDDAVGSRVGGTYYDKLDPARLWTIDTNGDHFTCTDAPILKLVVPFFDRFVGQKHNEFDATPHVQIWHETTAAGPSWVTTYRRWPVPVTPVHLHLSAGGSMAIRPGQPGSNSYSYPLQSSSMDDTFEGQPNLLWKRPDAPGGWAAYTTPKLTRDVEFYGGASANLVFSSTAPDTDIQVTLTEVRPDGQELYVQRGWLRASQRKLDPAQSTQLRPFQTHLQKDQEMLQPGKPTPLRVEIFPFDHVFRKGSSIRLWIDAPTGTTGLWAFQYLTTPSTNTIYTGPKTDSQLVLGVAPSRGAPKPEATCDTIINEPCRPNPVPVPAGHLTIPAAAQPTPACGAPVRLTVDTRGLARGRIVRVVVYDGTHRWFARRGRDITRVSFRRPAGNRVHLKIVMTTATGKRISVRRTIAGCSR